MLARRSARACACVSGESVLLVNSTMRPGVLGLRGERKDDLPGDAARGSGLSWAGAAFDSSPSSSSTLERTRGRWDCGLDWEKKAEIRLLSSKSEGAGTTGLALGWKSVLLDPRWRGVKFFFWKM
jgi:hypothetical protein